MVLKRINGYDMRTANFKKDVSKDLYLKQMADDGRNWSLKSYKVLNIHQFEDVQGDITSVQMIMEFNETGTHSYNFSLWNVRWRRKPTSS
jgi:hypothetical protein